MTADFVFVLETTQFAIMYIWDESHSENGITCRRWNDVGQHLESHQAQMSLLLHFRSVLSPHVHQLVHCISAPVISPLDQRVGLKGTKRRFQHIDHQMRGMAATVGRTLRLLLLPAFPHLLAAQTVRKDVVKVQKSQQAEQAYRHR